MHARRVVGDPLARASVSRARARCAPSGGLVLALLLVAGCKATGQQGAPDPSSSIEGPNFDSDRIPSIDVPRIEAAEASSIKIDGVLDELLWKKAAKTGTFVDVGSGRLSPDSIIQGTARLLYSDQGLYIGFEVKDPNVVGGFPKDAVDPHLWERDTIEIMTKPEDDGSNKDYYEIQISPQNLVFDSHFDDYNQPRGGPSGPFGHQEYKADLNSAVIVHGTVDDDSDTDDGYTVEVFIDFRSFGARPAGSDTSAHGGSPFRGKTLRMNFYAMKNNGGVGWSPILGLGNFHFARRFGRVHLAD
jgi:Carbohydrate family 9 binding domain-like